MKATRLARLVACGGWLLASGCTSLREIPRSDFSVAEEPREVRVETRDGLIYEFDFARVRNDSFIGYHRRDLEGSTDDCATGDTPHAAMTTFKRRGAGA